MRAFLAIDLPEDVSFALSQVMLALPVGRPVPSDNLHLTLAFLDDQPDEQLEQLHHELDAIQFQAFDLGFDGLGSFGSGPPKILYARIAESAALTDLHRSLRRAAHCAGIVLPRERYKPHVTLARFGRGLLGRDALRLDGFVAEYAALSLPRFRAEQFSLYRSTLHRDGAIHQELASYRTG